MKRYVSKVVLSFCLVVGMLLSISTPAFADGLLPAFTQDEIDSKWVADRFFPTDDATSVSAFGRSKVLRIGIDKTQTQAGTFQRTEGIKTPDAAANAPAGNFGTEVEIDLYIDSDWQNKAVRAGVWTVGDTGSGARDELYGIIEFVNLETCPSPDCTNFATTPTHTGFRIWDSNIGWSEYLTTPFVWDTWVTLRIVLDTTAGEYQYYINDELVGTAAGGTNYIREVFLNSYNFGADNFPTLSRNSYAAHWHNGVPVVELCTGGDSELVTPLNMSDWTINNSYNSQNLSVYEFTADGITIDNPVNEAKTIILRPVNIPLAEINFLDFDVTGNGIFTPTYQLQVTGWEDGAAFATLVWEAVYNDPDGKGVFDGYWWRTGSALGVPNGVNSATPYESRHKVTLEEILDANPDLVIIAYGISYGSYQPGDALVTSINFDCFETTFGLEPVTVPAPTVNEIVACNTYGSVILPEVEGATVTADPENATQGDVTVTAVALPGYTIIGDTEWVVSIGDYYLCQAQVVKPVPAPITQCGMTGNIYYFQVEGLTFVETPPDAIEGEVDVTYTVADGYEAVGSDLGPWTFDLGTYEACEPEVITETETVTVTEPITVNIPVTTEVPVTTTIPVTVEVPITTEIPVTTTVPITVHVPVTTEVPVTTTVPVTVELPITISEPITVSYPVTVEIHITQTFTNYEAGTPVFVNGTCTDLAGKVVLPVSMAIDYGILGNTLPGNTTRVKAVLREGIEGSLIGTNEWEYTFPTEESLNCGELDKSKIYFPQLSK